MLSWIENYILDFPEKVSCRVVDLFDKFLLEFKEDSLHDKFYKIVIVLTSLLFFFFLINIFFTNNDDVPQTELIASILAGAIVSLCVIAVSIEILKFIKNTWKEIWFKLILGILTIIIYAYSEFRANYFINNYVEIDPSFLPFGSTILTLFYLIPSWVLAVSVFLSITIFLGRCLQCSL